MRANILVLLLALFIPGLVLLGPAPAPSQEAEEQPAADNAEALARGPVHEAYAEPVSYRPDPGPVVAKKPPDAIEEQPPDQKPEGDDVRWMPGYWAWDDDGKEFLWVSGFWRNMPPGQRWVPGSWQEVEGGYQWSPGLWASDKAEAVNYVPTPPPSIDIGPPVPAAQESDVYVPGCWVWQTTRFLWRPGFWMTYRLDWLWVPAHYVWTPGGCVFVDGYWDHPLDRRGLLFCPIRLVRPVAVGWVYTPRYVVRSDFLMTALFVSPTRHHYFFGDYFTDVYQKRGFLPWVDYRPTRRSYDPLFNHYRVAFRAEPAWDRNLHELYRARYAGDVARPPHTVVEQQKVIQNLTVNKTANVSVIKNVNVTNVQAVSALAPLKEVHNLSVTNLAALAPAAKAPPVREIKLQQVNKEQITREKEHIQQVREVAQKRTEIESKLVAGGTVHVKSADGLKGVKLDLPKPAAPPPPPKSPVKVPPPPPPPKHEERPVPQHEPPKPPQPPRQPAKPPEKPKGEKPKDEKSKGEKPKGEKPTTPTAPPHPAPPPKL
jgi:hypothetical protein